MLLHFITTNKDKKYKNIRYILGFMFSGILVYGIYEYVVAVDYTKDILGIVLDTANSQLKEQEKETAKVISLENKKNQQTIDLAELVDDSKIDWDKWVSFEGKPLTDEAKEEMKRVLGKRLENKDK